MDELSELYLNHEQIQEAYIVDCISLMLLSKAYEEFAHVVERQSRLYLAELSFLGVFKFGIITNGLGIIRHSNT